MSDPTITDAGVIVTCPRAQIRHPEDRDPRRPDRVGDATQNGRELSVAGYLADPVILCLIGRDAHRIEGAAALVRG